MATKSTAELETIVVNTREEYERFFSGQRFPMEMLQLIVAEHIATKQRELMESRVRVLSMENAIALRELLFDPKVDPSRTIASLPSLRPDGRREETSEEAEPLGNGQKGRRKAGKVALLSRVQPRDNPQEYGDAPIDSEIPRIQEAQELEEE